MKWVVLENLIMEVCFTVCICGTAIHFEKPKLLAWLLLMPFLTTSYRETPARKDEGADL